MKRLNFCLLDEILVSDIQHRACLFSRLAENKKYLVAQYTPP